MVSLNSLKRLHKPMSLLGVGGLAAMASVAMGVAQPAQAANVTCQAINATSIINGTIPSPRCGGAVNANDTWEIDLSNIFAANTLSVNDFYSLQIANINPGASNALSFGNVEFLVSGAIGGQSFNDSPITVWSSTLNSGGNATSNANGGVPAFPFAQGLTGYSTNNSSNTFGGVQVSNKANFTLSSPNAASYLGIAGLINTQAIKLSDAGVTSFTGAKIRGTFLGSTTGFSGFSAGLAVFPTFTGTEAPTTIYGNAFNVPVPGPLPLFGAAASFGWSRKLRRRVSATKIAA